MGAYRNINKTTIWLIRFSSSVPFMHSFHSPWNETTYNLNIIKSNCVGTRICIYVFRYILVRFFSFSFFNKWFILICILLAVLFYVLSFSMKFYCDFFAFRPMHKVQTKKKQKKKLFSVINAELKKGWFILIYNVYVFSCCCCCWVLFRAWMKTFLFLTNIYFIVLHSFFFVLDFNFFPIWYGIIMCC